MPTPNTPQQQVTDEQALGRGLRFMRKTAGLTLEQVAQTLGISGAYLSKVENGVCSPRPEWFSMVMAHLCRALPA